MSVGKKVSSRMHFAKIGPVCGLTSVLLLLLLTAAPSFAAVEEKLDVTHLYNEVHSLTGGCGTSKDDKVKDPACTEIPEGTLPPEGALANPSGVAVDAYGDRYIVNNNPSQGPETSNIDIFDPTGHYIGGFNVNANFVGGFVDVLQTTAAAVDSTGHLYLTVKVQTPCCGGTAVVRYDPITYKPEAGDIAYGSAPVLLAEPGPLGFTLSGGLAVSSANDHFYINRREYVVEYGPPTDGVPNEVVTEAIGKGVLRTGNGGPGPVVIDSQHNKLYVTDEDVGAKTNLTIDVFSATAPYDLLAKFDGSTTPAGELGITAVGVALTVDEKSGDFFVEYQRRIYELEPDGTYVATMRNPTFSYSARPPELAYDNSEQSPNEGYLYVPTGEAQGHLYAYEPIQVPEPPIVESISVSGVSEDEAVLHATINPSGEGAHYVFEYTTETDFEESGGFANAQVTGEGQTPLSGEGVPVSSALHGLSPGTAYRFRVRAENQCEPGGCESEAQSTFKTFAPYKQSGTCANQTLRVGESAPLPDCRAYELVTPADTGGRPPLGPGFGGGPNFGTWNASPDGSSVAFTGEGGAFPGQDASGGFNGDVYVARRGQGGWSTEAVGMTGRQATSQAPGGLSPDHGFAATEALGKGNVEGELVGLEGRALYIRYPDGSAHLAGEGSIGEAKLGGICNITTGGSHIVLIAQEAQLEPDAAPTGTTTIYDRTSDGLHVVSLLPGEITPAAGEDASCEGTSADGSVVAFKLGASSGPLKGPLYLRLDNAETVEAPEAVSGQAVSCSAGSNLAGGTPSYEWLLDGSPIPAATGSTYTPESGQAGSVLQCIVRVQNAEGASIAASPPLTIDEFRGAGAPPRTAQVGKLPSEPAVGQTIECQPGSWLYEPSFSYEWYRNGTAIAGATSASYQVQAADARKLLQCAVAGSANGTTTLAFSDPTEAAPPKPPTASASPAISNVTHPGLAPVAGDELSCSEGTWANGPTFSYRWLRDGAPIASATSANYTVAAEDEEDALQCEVAATNADGTEAAASAVVAVSPLVASTLPQGSVSLKGVRAVGSTLECDKGTWQGSPSFAYEWLRNGTPIAGATSSTYKLVGADRETVVQCALKASNAAGAIRMLDEVYVNQKPIAAALFANPTFAGLSDDGRYLFYLSGGALCRYDSQGNVATVFSEGAEAAPAYVSTDGSTAYFTSKAVLTPEENPNGVAAVGGLDNLYLAREGGIRFVATVTEDDVEGSPGFSEWLGGIDRSGLLPLRATPEGSTLLFASHADLTDFKSGGKAQIYRYDANEGSLLCVSCNQTQELPHSEARLLTSLTLPEVSEFAGVGVPASNYSIVPNLSADGKRAFFESKERLVPADEDGFKDVYEWEAQGKGSCAEPGGCIFLISSGQSARDDYLYGASESGDDVFIYSSDLLNGEDVEEAPSVYDAKVEGGFPPRQAPAGECQGEACQPAAVAPDDPTPASSSFEGSGNVKPEGEAKARCPKGRKAASKGGKTRCVPSHHKKKQHKRAKHNRRAGR